MRVLAAGRRAARRAAQQRGHDAARRRGRQAATALENARLYGQLSGKADEIERLRQFSDSVVESLTDGAGRRRPRRSRAAVEPARWKRSSASTARARSAGRLSALFSRPFVDTLQAARRESPAGTTLYRVPLDAGPGERHARRCSSTPAIAPFQTAEGAQAGWIIVLEDITDRANLEEQLRLSEKMAAIGLLAAGVAHEVNTPLTGISSFTQMLLERCRSGRSEDAAAREDRAADVPRRQDRQQPAQSRAAVRRRDAVRSTSTSSSATCSSLLEHQFRMSQIQVRKRSGRRRRWSCAASSTSSSRCS